MMSFMRILYMVLIALISCVSHAQKTDYNKPSKTSGTVSNGSIKNAYKFRYKTPYYKYFSRFSYHILRRGFVHSDVYTITNNTLESMHQKHPKQKWRLMECSKKHGGRMLPHHTHQNGTSIDFMTPLKKNGKQFTGLNSLGIFHYILKYTPDGKWGIRRNIEIDFDLMAEFILELDKKARIYGMKVKKVILRTNLKDEFYATPNGKKIKTKRIYLVKYMPKIVNEQRDEHFHIDVEWL